jgi:hypothetical protein
MHRATTWHGLFWSVALVCVAGCDDGQRLKIVPVKGKLLIGGKPAARANVVLHSTDPHVVVRPVTFTEADGSFRLMTYKADDGAPVGDYVVTIFWRDESIPFDGCVGPDLVKHDRFLGAYFDSRDSPLRTTIHPGSNEIVIQADDVSQNADK